MKVHNNYIFVKSTKLDTRKLKNSCYVLENYLKNNIPNINKFDAKTNLDSYLFNRYNVLHFPLEEFHSMFREIKYMFNELSNSSDGYYIQCWMNIYNKGDFIDWHEHWKYSANSWHGFVCIDCEPSKTTYVVQGIDSMIDIPSKNGNIVMSRSGKDLHRTWPWEFEDRDRITIAFDIVPSHKINISEWGGNWVPL